MNLKVLAFTTIYPNASNPGLGVFIEHRIRHLRESEQVDVRVVAPVPWFPFDSPYFPRYSVFARAPRSETRHTIGIDHPRYPVIPKVSMNIAPFLLAASLVRPLRRIIQQGYNFDLLDAYYFYPDGIAALILGRYFQKQVIITGLGSDINVFSKFRLPRRLIRWAASSAAGVTTVCQSLKDGLIQLGVREQQVRVILHGVDLNLFCPPADRPALRRRLCLNGPTLLSVGNLIELKGHHIVIEALTKVPQMELVIAGRGELENELKKCAILHGVENRIRFLGYIDQHELCDYYGAADALILASSREGIPNVLLESMACGTPVVSTKVGGIAEVVTSGEAGILCTERSPAAMVAGICSLFAAYPDRHATRRFVERFSWEQTVQQHLLLMHDVMSPSALKRTI